MHAASDTDSDRLSGSDTVPGLGDAPIDRGGRSEDGAGGTLTVRLRDLHKAFGSKKVLTGIDLDVRTGESLVIIGASGTGKSVLLKHIIGLMKPDRGLVEVDGIDVSTLGYREITRFRRRFGMAFQEGALFDSMNVRENVAFPLRRQSKQPLSEIYERVDGCLELVKLEGIGDKMPSELSGGMRRRVGFARAIALEPEIVLFDEPTTGLDPVTTAQIDEVILDLLGRLDSTAITITHDMTSAFRIADRIGMLHEGKIIALAPPDEFRHLDDPRVQQFIRGEPDGPLANGGGNDRRRVTGASAEGKGSA
jgi:phospholipid/cholesterol/gamma-HCH transport system ATP-binding protein